MNAPASFRAYCHNKRDLSSNVLSCKIMNFKRIKFRRLMLLLAQWSGYKSSSFQGGWVVRMNNFQPPSQNIHNHRNKFSLGITTERGTHQVSHTEQCTILLHVTSLWLTTRPPLLGYILFIPNRISHESAAKIEGAEYSLYFLAICSRSIRPDYSPGTSS